MMRSRIFIFVGEGRGRRGGRHDENVDLVTVFTPGQKNGREEEGGERKGRRKRIEIGLLLSYYP